MVVLALGETARNTALRWVAEPMTTSFLADCPRLKDIQVHCIYSNYATLYEYCWLQFITCWQVYGQQCDSFYKQQLPLCSPQYNCGRLLVIVAHLSFTDSLGPENFLCQYKTLTLALLSSLSSCIMHMCLWQFSSSIQLSYCMTFFIIVFICCFRHISMCLTGNDMYALCQQWVMLYHIIAYSCQYTSIIVLPLLSFKMTGFIHTYLFLKGCFFVQLQ